MDITELSPFGVKITNIDIDSSADINFLRNAVWKHGVVVLPEGCARLGAPDPHLDTSLLKIGRLFGELENYHPILPGKSGPVDELQVLKTGGDSGTKPDSYHRHSDFSYRPNPSTVAVLSAVLLPPGGGRTCFQSANNMFHRLSPELRDKLYGLLFRHSFRTGYERNGRPDDAAKIKTDLVTEHPAIVMHPVTGVPLLYVNSNFTTTCPDLSEEESEELLDEIYKQAYSPEHTLEHTWKEHDVVIFDNIGTQHFATNDYTDLRIMYIVTAWDSTLRFNRYTGNISPAEAAEKLNQLMFGTGNTREQYDLHAPDYDNLVHKSGYKCPQMAVAMLARHLDGSQHGRRESGYHILDIGAGTGINAMQLLKHGYGKANVWQNCQKGVELRCAPVTIDAYDYSVGMLAEARRRDLYCDIYVHDANNAFPAANDAYDAIICTDALAPHHIYSLSWLREMIRITRAGGVIALTFAEDYDSIYLHAVMDAVQGGKVRLLEKKTWNEKAWSEIRGVGHLSNVAVLLQKIY